MKKICLTLSLFIALTIFVIASACTSNKSNQKNKPSQSVKKNTTSQSITGGTTNNSSAGGNTTQPGTGTTTNKPSTKTTTPPSTGSTSSVRTFTINELKKYNGQNGNPAYVAVNGTVYDVTNARRWRNGRHVQGIVAGVDLSSAIQNSPHGLSVLRDLPIIGKLK